MAAFFIFSSVERGWFQGGPCKIAMELLGPYKWRYKWVIMGLFHPYKWSYLGPADFLGTPHREKTELYGGKFRRKGRKRPFQKCLDSFHASSMVQKSG